MEVTLRSGHADRGFVISDRPVVQPVTWVSGSAGEFSVWGNYTLTPATDGTRPEILEMELTRERKWGNLTIAPAVTMYFYHDPLNIDNEHSIEGWLRLSYDVGPFRLFTNHSVDVLTYEGAYFGEAGITSERRVSQEVKVGGSVGAGWASAKFNDAYVGVDQAALNRVNVEGWLTVNINPHVYIGPQVECSTIVDPAVRAALVRPSFCFVGLTTGVEH